MTLEEDGRWLLSYDEIKAKIWEKLRGWVVNDLNNPTHLIPNFPECQHRELKQLCLPCGKKSGYNYNCKKKNSLVSPSYCKGCIALGEHL